MVSYVIDEYLNSQVSPRGAFVLHHKTVSIGNNNTKRL